MHYYHLPEVSKSTNEIDLLMSEQAYDWWTRISLVIGGEK